MAGCAENLAGLSKVPKLEMPVRSTGNLKFQSLNSKQTLNSKSEYSKQQIDVLSFGRLDFEIV